MPRWLATCLACASGVGVGACVAAPASPAAPEAAWILVRDGHVLEARQADAPHAPASLAKLLTALQLLDAGWQPGRWLPVSVAAASAEPARAGLRAGDEVRADDALAAMLIHSANDACRVLVESVPGGEAALLAAMAQRARSLGLAGTNIVDPCGFDATGQRTTATDLLLLAQAAWAQPRVRALAGQARGELRTRAGRPVRFTNSNALLGRLPGTVGLKTGYTQAAGPCVIAVVQRNGHEAWLVLLGAEDRWWRAHALLEGAFAGPGVAPAGAAP